MPPRGADPGRAERSTWVIGSCGRSSRAGHTFPGSAVRAEAIIEETGAALPSSYRRPHEQSSLPGYWNRFLILPHVVTSVGDAVQSLG